MTRWLVIGLLGAIILSGCSNQADRPHTDTTGQSQRSSREQDQVTEPKFYIERDTVIGPAEAGKVPPLARWPALQELDKAAWIDVLCHPNGTEIRDKQIVAEIVKLMQEGSYVQARDLSQVDPQIKVYFRRADGSFIMAAKVYLIEGILDSPEGPLIKVASKVSDRFVEDGRCKPR